MPRDLRAYLWDIREAARRIVEFTRGKSQQDYNSDALLRSGVERQFEIIGEALRQALHSSADIEKQITDCRQIIAFRDRLIHGYSVVSNEVVWGIVETQVDTLLRETEALLGSRDKK